jgi:hypothetical protein
MTAEGKVMMLFIDFHKLVVRDGVDPQNAHREFLKIDEYRGRIGLDIQGVDLRRNSLGMTRNTP